MLSLPAIPNDVLKKSFRRVHDKVVNCSMSSVIDRLFARGVISAEDNHRLHVVSPASHDPAIQTRQLLDLLHMRNHPKAFVELRRALGEEPAYRWIIDEVDKLASEEISVTSPELSQPPSSTSSSLRLSEPCSSPEAAVSCDTSPSCSSNNKHKPLHRGSPSAMNRIWRRQLAVDEEISNRRVVEVTVSSSSTESDPFDRSTISSSDSLSSCSIRTSDADENWSMDCNRRTEVPCQATQSESPAFPHPVADLSSTETTEAGCQLSSGCSTDSVDGPGQGVVTTPSMTPTHAYKRHPLLLATVHASCGPICGIAELNRTLFVAMTSSDVINTYVANKTATLYEQTAPPIRVKGLRNPVDLVACPEDDRLLISDAAARCVWYVDVPPRGKVKIGRLIPESSSPSPSSPPIQGSLGATEDWVPGSLSVRSRRLLVTPSVTGSGCRLLALHLYRVGEGRLCGRVRLPSDITKVNHAVETSRDTFVICYFVGADCRQGQVSELDTNGRVLCSYGDVTSAASISGASPVSATPVCSNYRFIDPRYITTDSDGRLIVADAGTRQVLLLDASLGLERTLLAASENGIGLRPWRICLIERLAQLIVGHSETKDMLVYRVRPK